MSGHTPGPWASRSAANGSAVTVCNASNGATVATIKSDHPDTKGRKAANARLIAAAPELLGELMRATAQMEMAADCIEAGRYDEALLHVCSLSRGRRAAIAKATGESA